jgi:hypothetical protein
MKSLIVFAGAGASRGVSGDKYPMALDFRKRLPDVIKQSDLYQRLIAHLEQQGLKDIDIEHVLWELGRLNETIREWTEPERLASRLLSSNEIASITGMNTQGPSVHNQFHNLFNISQNLQDQINERVYEFYSQPPQPEELKRSWIPLLEYLSESEFNRIDIVTTNYDLVIEAALDTIPDAPVSMGFRQGLYPGIELRAWRDNTPSQRGLLTKLHGSVDWKLGNGSTEAEPVIRRGHPEFDGDHKKRLILYPGFKGVPSREPFVAFHEYFRQRLQTVTHVLFIGFAFRDQFINELVEANLPKNSRVAVVNPSTELPNLGFLRSVTHLPQGFGISENATLLTSGGLKPFSLRDLNERRQ